MGLDLLVMSKPKPGFESRFSDFVHRIATEQNVSELEKEEFYKNTVPAYETLNAPKVGSDAAADEWIVSQRQEGGDARSRDEILRDFQGFNVLRLVQNCDGLPSFSNGGLYEGVDETSFRGTFLEGCTSLLDKQAIEMAWTKIMTPELAVSYGALLLQRADQQLPTEKVQGKGLLAKLFGSRKQVDVAEQREILQVAGRWYLFWGGRGHHIEAYF